MNAIKVVILTVVTLACIYFTFFFQIGGTPTDLALAQAANQPGQSALIAQAEFIEYLKNWAWCLPVILAALFYGPVIIRSVVRDVNSVNENMEFPPKG